MYGPALSILKLSPPGTSAGAVLLLRSPILCGYPQQYATPPDVRPAREPVFAAGRQRGQDKSASDDPGYPAARDGVGVPVLFEARDVRALFRSRERTRATAQDVVHVVAPAIRGTSSWSCRTSGAGAEPTLAKVSPPAIATGVVLQAYDPPLDIVAARWSHRCPVHPACSCPSSTLCRQSPDRSCDSHRRSLPRRSVRRRRPPGCSPSSNRRPARRIRRRPSNTTTPAVVTPQL